VLLSAVFADKTQPKHVGKMPEIGKSFSFEVVITYFGKFLEKHRHNPHIFSFESSSRNWSIGFSDEVSAKTTSLAVTEEFTSITIILNATAQFQLEFCKK